MPSLVVPQIPHYVPAPSSSEDLDYADLTIVDLSKASTPEGRADLAIQVRDAMRSQGFFYAIHHGYSMAENERIFDIADAPFTLVSEEEKRTYAGNMKVSGSHQGYKLRQYWHIENGVHDQVENYNINRDITKRPHPKEIRPLLPEIEAFAKFNHFRVLHPILRLLALGMELPEESFVNVHGYDAIGETYVRFMKYHPRSEEEEAVTKNIWMKGHTDFGSVTMLWSQPVAALQILSADGKWRWVKHIENALVVNVGDCMDFLSGGFYKGTIHRVVQPPADQRGHTRLGVFYFALPDDELRLVPFAESPALQRVGIQRRCADEDAPTTETWRKSRTAAYGTSELKRTDELVEEEVLEGVVVKHYT